MRIDEKFLQGNIDIHLGNGNVVRYNRNNEKVMVLSPNGNPWSVKKVPEGYTLDQFCKYCESVAKVLKTKVFPWSDPEEREPVNHPDIIPA